MAATHNLVCPACNAPLELVTGKAFVTKAAQYAYCCVTHGRVQANWSTSDAGALAKAVVKPSLKTKHAAPVA